MTFLSPARGNSSGQTLNAPYVLGPVAPTPLKAKPGLADTVQGKAKTSFKLSIVDATGP